jgi:hypothetical protein
MAMSGGEDGAELGEVALQGLLRASNLLNKMQGCAANENRGSEMLGTR